MRVVSEKEIWRGYFSYEIGYPDVFSLREVKFEIDIVVENNSFIGISIDEESENYFDEPTKIKGFFQDGFISFIMKYPYNYYRDENDEIKVDKKKQHPEVNYYGELDKENNLYKGKWEIVQVIDQLIDRDIEEVYSGYWELKKMN